MMHRAWCSIENVPYCVFRPFIKFQGHAGWKIDDLNPIWVRILGRSQLPNPLDLPCFGRLCVCASDDTFDKNKNILGPNSKDRTSARDKANIGNPKVNSQPHLSKLCGKFTWAFSTIYSTGGLLNWGFQCYDIQRGNVTLSMKLPSQKWLYLTWVAILIRILQPAMIQAIFQFCNHPKWLPVAVTSDHGNWKRKQILAAIATYP